MAGFSLAKHPAMTVAPGRSKNTGQDVTEITGAGSRVLLVADPALRKLGLGDAIESSVREAGHILEIFDDLQSDPKESSVDAATKIAFDMKADCVVGLGGGSALDTAKVVAVLAGTGEPCAPYRLARAQLPFRKTALIAIPTTAGTGSETTGTSIISEASGTKNWFWGPPLKPDLALMDPELTTGLPPFWTFYTGMDALVHSIESRTNRYRFAENDGLAEKGIAFAVENLVTAVREPENLEARTGMMLAAAYGGLAIGNTGCAVAHNIGHALGSIAGIPHGRAVSVALVATLEWTIPGSPEAFGRVAELLGVGAPDEIAGKLWALADECGQSLSMTGEERAKIDAAILSKDMVDDANIAMLEATARDADESDVLGLAEMTLAA